MKCKYCDDGCEFEQIPSKKQILDDHEKECEHRIIDCTVLACDIRLSLSTLFLHLKDDHTINLDNLNQTQSFKGKLQITSQNLKEASKWITWTSRLVILNEGKQFYTQCARSPTGLFFLWVYIIGTPIEEEKFTYTLTVSSDNKVILLISCSV